MAEETQEEINPMQKLLDNDFFLLAFHVGISLLFYVVWGVIELMSVPSL